nr:MAG TPA: hypothetical protein [Bacteriophage sp.]
MFLSYIYCFTLSVKFDTNFLKKIFFCVIIIYIIK